MPTSPYNPQEILDPLMKRFGRHLTGSREEGYAKMVTAIGEELHVDEPHARQLLETLVHSRLIDYEPVAPTTTADQILPKTETVQTLPGTATDQGAWRLGPPIT